MGYKVLQYIATILALEYLQPFPQPKLVSTKTQPQSRMNVRNTLHPSLSFIITGNGIAKKQATISQLVSWNFLFVSFSFSLSYLASGWGDDIPFYRTLCFSFHLCSAVTLSIAMTGLSSQQTLNKTWKIYLGLIQQN